MKVVSVRRVSHDDPVGAVAQTAPRPEQAKILPPAVREALWVACQAPKAVRHLRIDEATAWAKRRYPQYFKQPN